jgi:hypothetical protein
MRDALRKIGSGAAVLAYIYGIYRAVMLFFEIQHCAGTNCTWIFSSWHPLAWGLLFLMVWIPFVPLGGMVLSLPWSLPGALLYWLSGLGKR